MFQEIFFLVFQQGVFFTFSKSRRKSNMYIVYGERLFFLFSWVPVYLCLPWNVQSKPFGSGEKRKCLKKKKWENKLRGLLILIDMGLDVGKRPTKRLANILRHHKHFYYTLFFFLPFGTFANRYHRHHYILNTIPSNLNKHRMWQSIKIGQKPTYKNIFVICGERKWEIKSVFVIGKPIAATPVLIYIIKFRPTIAHHKPFSWIIILCITLYYTYIFVLLRKAKKYRRSFQLTCFPDEIRKYLRNVTTMKII